MTVRIVTHAYAKDLPQYAVFLRAQLSSLVLHGEYSITVCCHEGDLRTVAVIDAFAGLLGERLAVIPMSKGDLFRRAIGRNEAAMTSSETVVWFADVDHYFGVGCIRAVDEFFKDPHNEKTMMVSPIVVKVNSSFDEADKLWASQLNRRGDLVSTSTWKMLDVADAAGVGWESKAYNRAIGGVQIVRGAFARRYGYLNDSEKYQTPTDGVRPFPCFRDDVAFRRFVQQKGLTQGIAIPNLYRMRHSQTTYKAGDHV